MTCLDDQALFNLALEGRTVASIASDKFYADLVIVPETTLVGVGESFVSVSAGAYILQEEFTQQEGFTGLVDVLSYGTEAEARTAFAAMEAAHPEYVASTE